MPLPRIRVAVWEPVDDTTNPRSWARRHVMRPAVPATLDAGLQGRLPE